jgi:hypothetical protein
VKCLIQDAQPYFRPTAGGAELLVGDNLPAHRQDEDDPDVWDETVSIDQMVRCSFFEMDMILHPRMLYSMVLLERTIAGFEASMRVIQSHACQVWVFLPFSP